MENGNQSRETTRGPNRGERFDEPWGARQYPKPRPLTPDQIAEAEQLRAALRNVDRAKIDRFFEEIDAIADPVSRYWPGEESCPVSD